MSKVTNTNQLHDHPYLNLICDVLTNGRKKTDRTGTGTTSVFGRSMRFDIRNGIIPLLTTKKMHIPSIIHEIIWYLSGNTNIKYLMDNKVRIWAEWADENGNLGPIYGQMWRAWPKYEIVSSNSEQDPDGSIFHSSATVIETKIDQIAKVIDALLNDHDSRRIIVNSWNVSELDKMNLPPCHYSFQFYTEEMTLEERVTWYERETGSEAPASTHEGLDICKVPRRYLSCDLTQR